MTEELRGKLRRLRREGGRAPREENGGPGELPTWLARKLDARAPRRGGESPVPSTSAPPEELVEVRREQGRFSVRLQVFGAEHRHGRFRLGEITAACCRTLALLARDEALGELDLERAVYLDIETTGLSGGAGTVPFLVALGTFAEGEFHLWQGFLGGPEEEHALLTEVAERIEAASGVVSFFGKSFDRHRLEDKMRLHGVTPPFEGLPHLDLFHPLARLYRSGFADGRLATVEAALCGVERKDDLPGSYAPEAWFDFLAGRPHRLEAVFRHNADDVLSLVVLAAHLGRTLEEARADGSDLDGPADARAAALARLHLDLREHATALSWIERAGERGVEARALAWLRAVALRGMGETARAAEEFERVATEADDERALEAAVALAKLAEHRLRDLGRAARAVERAQALAPRCAPRARRERLAAELSHRARRLASKATS